MKSFLKTLGLGILYTIAFPFFAVALALYGVYKIFILFYQGIRFIVIFFSGRDPFVPTEEEKKAKAIMLARATGQNTQPVEQKTETTIINNYIDPSATSKPMTASDFVDALFDEFDKRKNQAQNSSQITNTDVNQIENQNENLQIEQKPVDTIDAAEITEEKDGE